MKIILLLITTLFFQVAYSQEASTADKVQFDGSFRIYGAKYFNFGNNFLAKANNDIIGFGVDFSVLKFKDFSASAGYERVNYSVTDFQKAGNISGTRLNSFNFKLLYEQELSKRFSVQPFVGIGGPTLSFRSGRRQFGKQNGTDFKIGFNTDYYISKNFAFFITTEYILSKYKIQTVPELVKFYEDANALKFSLGIRFK